MENINVQIMELRELRCMMEELTAEIEAIQDSIKTVMEQAGVDTLTGADWKVTWKPVTSNRLDGKALKAALPEVAAQFTKTSTTRRFVLK